MSDEGYVDLYLLPVPTDKIELYKEQASQFAAAMLEHGALGYREFTIEDPANDGGVSFTAAVTVKEGETLTAAVAEFKSRAHRDEVMAKVLADPIIEEMIDDEPLADMARMHYGGFKQFVKG